MYFFNMKYLKLFEEYTPLSLGICNITFTEDTYLTNICTDDYCMDIKVFKGDKIEDIAVDYVDDNERIVDISNISLNQILQIDSEYTTKIDTEDYRSVITKYTPDEIKDRRDTIVYDSNIKNMSVTSVSYEAIDISFK